MQTTLANAALFAAYLSNHLKRYGVKNGSYDLSDGQRFKSSLAMLRKKIRRVLLR
jgi:hypothetical protein